MTSDYFNTLTQNEHEPKLIKAIIDEDVKATDGSRVRLSCWTILRLVRPW